MNWFKQLSKTQIILGIFAIIIVYLLYTNYIQSKQIIQPTTEKMTSVASQPNKSLLVLYYADWCGWSQKFLPVWNEFKNYASKNLSEKLTVKDVECTKSDNPVCKQVGYPTLRLVKPDGKEITFEGERSMTGLTQFCNQNL